MNLTISVEQCWDDEGWVWALHVAGDTKGMPYMDGYEATEAEAWAKARQAKLEELERLEGKDDR